MKPPNHMNFGYPKLKRLTGGLDNLGDGEFEGMRVAFSGTKGTELARKNANIGIVDVTIQDIGGAIPVYSLPDNVGDETECINVRRAIEPHRFVPMAVVRGVDGEFRRLGRDADSGRLMKSTTELIRESPFFETFAPQDIDALAAHARMRSVAAGEVRPNHVSTSDSLMPSSESVGTSGRAGMRDGTVTANARTLPVAACGTATGVSTKAKAVCPLSRLVMDSLLLR